MDLNVLLQELQALYPQAPSVEERELLDHLSSTLLLLSYVSKGQQIKQRLGVPATVLDWGAGFGQMTYILTRLGLQVTPYDVVQRQYNLFEQSHTGLVFGTKEVVLPFVEHSFDGVLSCGVLEHVPNFSGSLREVFRVLKPGGVLFVYNLPYVMSPSEWYAARKGTSVHPILFTKRGITQLLLEAGFTLEYIGHDNGIPKRLRGPLRFLQPWSNRWPALFLFFDRLLVKLPIIKSIISNSITAVARKPDHSP